MFTCCKRLHLHLLNEFLDPIPNEGGPLKFPLGVEWVEFVIEKKKKEYIPYGKSEIEP